MTRNLKKYIVWVLKMSIEAGDVKIVIERMVINDWILEFICNKCVISHRIFIIIQDILGAAFFRLYIIFNIVIINVKEHFKQAVS